MAWRNITDCPAADIDGTPVVVSAASSGSCLFHFTMTSSEVRFIRDNTLALILYLDITPDVFHTYYLALHGDLSYEWYIDANIVNSGQYPAAYPISDANLIWAARYYKDNQTTKWDYIRYGVVPADHSGDFDSNGLIDSTDVYYFVDCLLGPDYDAAGPGCKWADMNADGKADGADIQLFVHAMTGG